jgi:hypothetical protein
MSVVVWKDGESLLVEPFALQRHLDAGYTLDDKPKAPKASDEELQLRQDAKDLGIKNYHNMKLDNLKIKIEEALDDSDKE